MRPVHFVNFKAKGSRGEPLRIYASPNLGLQNAASIAGLILTTGYVMADDMTGPEPEPLEM